METATNLVASRIVNLNRTVYQNLTAQTTTSLTPVVAATITITPRITGRVKVHGVTRANNNTLTDGITVSLYMGTTLIDSHTYTQEGLAGNSVNFVMEYDTGMYPNGVLQDSGSLAIGVPVTFNLEIEAVTGGTVTYQTLMLSAEEY